MGATWLYFSKDCRSRYSTRLRLPEPRSIFYARTGCRAVRKRGGAEDTRKPRLVSNGEERRAAFHIFGVRESELPSLD